MVVEVMVERGRSDAAFLLEQMASVFSMSFNLRSRAGLISLGMQW